MDRARPDIPIDAMTRRDPRYPTGDPTIVMPRHTAAMPVGRIRAAIGLNRLIRAACALIASLLIVHVLLVLLRANFDNSVAAIVNDWASAVSLGLRDLFTFDDPRFRVALGEGVAALLWLIAGRVVTTLIVRVFVPHR